MTTLTSHLPEPDEVVVERARRMLVQKRKARWITLIYAGLFLGLTGYFTIVATDKMQGSDAEWLQIGFINGLALAVVWGSFGVLGALCLGKFVSGFKNDYRLQELLVKYHDRLRDLGQLPKEGKSETKEVSI